ncbi:ribosomal-protein-alanine N-acetyltransferase [Longimycelium tulufanense]|uniref:Ribosomal-protein-alanine N-acetyltransferase n=1 Tax=Longimycelium tulufanense TaxID=907463 RepID=A0A8J3CCQ0_9PSEU|nr:GNAT family protein [Longimycelium tulufanense]GGM59890.1 ribosomal-protein-alanine N-acetyltransferase [Longimycelium tulufanense]
MRAGSKGQLYQALKSRLYPDHPGWPTALGPRTARDGRSVRLRPPRLADAEQWSALVRRERMALEPWWPTSVLPWEDRFTTRTWYERWARLRWSARRGYSLPAVIEVDGRLAGEVVIDRIDRTQRSGEAGMWIAAEHHGSGVASHALQLIMSHAFGPLDLHRLVAPIAVNNRAAAVLAASHRFKREGVMRDYMHVGGRWRDHVLWSVLTNEFISSLTAASAEAAPRPT